MSEHATEIRWGWKQWQALVKERVTDVDALKLAEVWPGYVKGKHHRCFWAHEMTYKTLPDWSMSRVMKAANILEAVGLSSRCPGTPLYVSTMPKQEGASDE
jgi:hypothetical protein